MPLARAQILGEALGAFELGGGGVGAEHRKARGPQRIADAGDQRRFGADDDQIDRPRSRASSVTAAASQRVDRDAFGPARDARIARRCNAVARSLAIASGARRAHLRGHPNPTAGCSWISPKTSSAGLLAEVAPGDNSPPLTVSELSRRLKRTIETSFGPGPRARRDFRLQAPRLGPLLFHPEGRWRLHRRGRLAVEQRQCCRSGPRTAPKSSPPAS